MADELLQELGPDRTRRSSSCRSAIAWLLLAVAALVVNTAVVATQDVKPVATSPGTTLTNDSLHPRP